MKKLQTIKANLFQKEMDQFAISKINGGSITLTKCNDTTSTGRSDCSDTDEEEQEN